MELIKTTLKCDIDGAIMTYIHASDIESFLGEICFCDSYSIESQTAPTADEKSRFLQGVKMGLDAFYLSSFALGYMTADEVKKECDL